MELHNGEYTYLSGGEIAIDIGQAKDAFYYPAADYEGLELVFRMDGAWKEKFSLLNKDFIIPEMLVDRCSGFEHPLIAPAGEIVTRIAKEIREYICLGESGTLLFVKVLELLVFLEYKDFHEMKRTYYTTSQVNIAKEVQKLITKDLSVRYTAKELAKKFGISETSLKNYFRNVYGNGYTKYQNEQRMKKAADLLIETQKKVVEIAEAVGYNSQTKFGIAFKEFYNRTPMEYRRLEKLSNFSDE